MALTSNASGLAKAAAIYEAMNDNMKAFLPTPTADNAKDFGAALMKYQPAYNDFMKTMLQKVVYGWARNAEDKNPFSIMEKGTLEYGYTIEEAYADALSVEDWSASELDDFSELFGVEPARVYTLFHSVNFQKRVKASIPDRWMRRAFGSWGELNDMIARIVRTLYTSMIGEERKASEKLLYLAHLGGFVKPVKVNSIDFMSVTDEDMQANTIAIKAYANRMAVSGSRDYNHMGVLTLTDYSDLYIWMTPEYLAAQDVSVLAAAFNMEKVEFLGHVVMVPGFGGAEDDGCVGFMTDRNWFQIWIQDRQMTEEYNARKRVWNYFYFTDAIYSFSQFSNCIELVSSEKSITSVTITDGQSVQKGTAALIDVSVVTGSETGGFSSKCNWSITGNASRKTFISPFGLLYIDPSETADSINVTATSAQDSTKSSTVAVTVTAG